MMRLLLLFATLATAAPTAEHAAAQRPAGTGAFDDLFNDDSAGSDGGAPGRLPNLFSERSEQADIQAALDRDGFAFLLPGSYALTETLTLPKRFGCALIGLGGGGDWAENAGLRSGGAVRLHWRGPDDAPVLRVRRADWRLDGLNIYGPAEVGVLVENDNTGLGTGKGYVPQLSVQDCKTGVRFGRHAEGDNGDVTSFGRLTLIDCPVGLQVIAPLSYQLQVNYVRNRRCGVLFDCQAGGGLHVYGGEILAKGGTLLRLGGVTPNASTYRLQGILVDAPAAEAGFKLLECTERSWADVTIQAHLPRADYPTPIATLIGPVSLKLDRCANLRPGAVQGIAHRAGAPFVIADACRLRGDWDNQQLLNGAGTARLRDCYTTRGAPVDASH